MAFVDEVKAAGPAPAGTFVRLGDGPLTHYAHTEGTGSPVLFLHGYIDSAHSFKALIESFSPARNTYSIDFRGHGSSEPAASYTIADLAGDAIAFLERVVGGPAHVVGHSLGSIVAQRVAAQRPDLVLKLVLIGAAPTAANNPDLSGLRAELAKYTDSVPVPFVEEFQRSTVFAPVSEDVINGYIAESLKVDISAWHGALAGLVDEPADAARSLGVSTLVISGEKDGLFGAETQEALARLLSAPRRVHYPDAGHAPHWEFPARVAADIEAFLGAP
jgi:pimeloyl-ACP methyl ester carboxylesterase